MVSRHAFLLCLSSGMCMALRGWPSSHCGYVHLSSLLASRSFPWPIASPVPRLCSARCNVDPGAYARWRWGGPRRRDARTVDTLPPPQASLPPLTVYENHDNNPETLTNPFPTQPFLPSLARLLDCLLNCCQNQIDTALVLRMH
ncbi:hypothetical protein EV356DRAFT_342518 [Viridothelium virens]|uniref:Secreted protein n=1 Tax=Viridothelium virens TaxID=1048519 RepID=A0A6A6GXX1_VIRVR|nr:hypothetical protein EV356DRAFT_342518 [Viridothelium virens]